MLEVLDLGSISKVHHQWQQTFPDPGAFSVEQVRSYWENLLQNLNLPRGSNNQLNIAVPCCYDCITRSIIKDILTQTYGYGKIKLIPRSLALIGGYLTLHPERKLISNLLCIWPEEDALDYSCISIAETGIILELQGIGNWVNLQNDAIRLGLINQPGGNINQLLYAAPAPSADLIWPVAELNNQFEILAVENPRETILLGLNYWAKADTARWNKVCRMIYPYDYYLERSAPANKYVRREKISFDTSNLELDPNGSYKIASLATSPLFFNPADQYVDLAIYEEERGSRPLNPFNCGPAMQLRLSKADKLDCLHLWLDMDSASIFQPSPPPSNMQKVNWSESSSFHLQSHESHCALAGLLENSSHPSLSADLFPDLLSRSRQISPNDIEGYFDSIQLKLYQLLELWSRID